MQELEISLKDHTEGCLDFSGEGESKKGYKVLSLMAASGELQGLSLMIGFYPVSVFTPYDEKKKNYVKHKVF